MKKRLIPLVSSISISLLSIILALQVNIVEGNSMNPLIEDGQMVISIRTTKFKKGEIVIASAGGKIVLKRIYGIQGDNIKIEDGEVYINEELVKKLSYSESGVDVVLKENEFFLLGDNPGTSYVITSEVLARVEKVK